MRAITIAVVMVFAAGAAWADDAALRERMNARLDAVAEQLIDVRRDIHRHPEVSGNEKRTAALVDARLKKLGFETRTGVGGHGIVAVLRGARPGPVVAFRADMDAVPSDAPDPVEFRSEIPGVRHICGHDIHTTIGLGLAEAFASVHDAFPGAMMLVFQPAEENASGARAMLADGVFDALEPSAIFAYHTAPMNVGQLVTAQTVLMTPRHGLEVRLAGTGDKLAAANAVRAELAAISTLSFEQTLQPAADTRFIVVQADAPRVEADGVLVRATVTTAADEAEARAKAEIARRLAGVTFENVTIAHDFESRYIAGVTNTPALVARATEIAESILGAGSVQQIGGLVPAFSEDFGSFQQRVPGAMFFLGVSNEQKGWIGMPHSPGYVADEAAIGLGAKVMAAILLNALSGD